MIEFKQIIGRGTRLFEGKDYFTVMTLQSIIISAILNDGEPIEPVSPTPQGIQLQPCEICGQNLVSAKPDTEPCEVCGYIDYRYDNPLRRMIKVKLADGKVRQFQHD